MKKQKKKYIPRCRLEELATQFKEGLIEDDEESAMEYFDEICKITDEEKEWFGIKQTAVLDKRTSTNQNINNLGDFVYCCNCGRTMLVDLGTQYCPECGEESFMWADEINKEVDEDFFNKNSNYILVDIES